LLNQNDELDVEVPEKLETLFDDTYYRYYVLKGGRGGGKSWAVALKLILKGFTEPCIILCTREVQRTIKDSVHRLLSDTIERLGLEGFYEVQRDKITGLNGTVFIFTGLQNSAGVKSIEGVTDCWIEEAAKVTSQSWKYLIPTVRKRGSSFYIVFNPDEESDPVNQFIDSPRPKTNIIDIQYHENKFFPDVLREEMEYDKEHDFEYYLHVWEGQYWSKADDQVMNGIWTIEEFETPPDADFMYGADFGFSEDPSAGVRCFIKGKNLYIDYEVMKKAVENEDLVEFFRGLTIIR
jgi:phage terminase large subunit